MTARLRDSTADRISNLSGDVIELILALLPIKEAARTSILSRKWRHCWRSIPQLVFDGRFAPFDEEYGYIPDEDKVMLKIFEALMAHDGLLTKFELSIPGFSYKYDPPLDLLMLHLSSKGVQELTIRFEDSDCDYPIWHSSLLSAAFPLKRIELQHCEFRVPSSFVGLSKLTLLELEDVILHRDFYQKVLPCCPLLQELRVIDCNVGEPVFVAPSLKVLIFDSSIGKICFKYTPHLSVVSVLDTDPYARENRSFLAKHNQDMVSLFASLPALQHLVLGVELLLLLAHGHVPYQLPAALHGLKSLEVPGILLHRLPQAQVLLCLIMSAPNLQRLTIQLDDSNEHPPSKVISSLQKLLKAENQPGVGCLQHLEEVNIEDSRGKKVELDLVRFVLATAPILRRISIKSKENLSSEKVTKLMNKMSLYKRISKEVEVKYVYNDVVDTLECLTLTL